ncbi:hypothetical protein OG21DRAFT_1492064 [Imleria badia]|nr:hypothetical protein OG21DRAFT_1492064 [Imleria badia]
MIVTTLSNIIFVHLVGKNSGHEYLTTLCSPFEKQSLVVSTKMCCRLGELKLKNGGDAHVHIDKIIALHEDLSSIGQVVLDEHLFNIIYVLLPYSYNSSLAALSSTMQLQSKTISSHRCGHTVFDNGTFQIFNAEQRLLGQVKVMNGLYKTQSDYIVTVATTKGDRQLTMEDLHCRGQTSL